MLEIAKWEVNINIFAFPGQMGGGRPNGKEEPGLGLGAKTPTAASCLTLLQPKNQHKGEKSIFLSSALGRVRGCLPSIRPYLPLSLLALLGLELIQCK